MADKSEKPKCLRLIPTVFKALVLVVGGLAAAKIFNVTSLITAVAGFNSVQVSALCNVITCTPFVFQLNTTPVPVDPVSQRTEWKDIIEKWKDIIDVLMQKVENHTGLHDGKKELFDTFIKRLSDKEKRHISKKTTLPSQETDQSVVSVCKQLHLKDVHKLPVRAWKGLSAWFPDMSSW